VTVKVKVKVKARAFLLLNPSDQVVPGKKAQAPATSPKSPSEGGPAARPIQPAFPPACPSSWL